MYVCMCVYIYIYTYVYVLEYSITCYATQLLRRCDRETAITDALDMEGASVVRKLSNNSNKDIHLQ